MIPVIGIVLAIVGWAITMPGMMWAGIAILGFGLFCRGLLLLVSLLAS